MTICKQAMTFRQFCESYSISLSYLYELLAAGRGPDTITLGRKRLISSAAAAAWLVALENKKSAS
jgi:hypothetical protein